MKVCHILPQYYPFYAAPYEYTQALAKKGVTVRMLALGRASEAAEETIGGVRIKRAPIAPHYVFSLRLLFNFVRFAAREVRVEKFDLVHVYAFRGCAFLPLICRHGNSSDMPWLLDVKTGNVNYKNSLLSCLANRSLGVESHAFDACAAQTQGTGEQVLGRSVRFHILPIGADMERFSPGRNTTLRRRLNIADDRVVVLFSGSLEPARSIETVLQGFAMARQKFSELFLLIIGSGSSRSALGALADNLGIDKDVCFTERVPFPAVHDFLRVGDIGLAYIPISIQFDHQIPLKTMEFLSCGLPTVATRTRGNCRLIKDGVSGLLVEDSAKDIAGGLIRLLDDRRLARAIAYKARQSVAQYNWDRIVEDQLLPLYDRLLGCA